MTRVKVNKIILLLGIIFIIPLTSYGAYEISDGSVKALYHLEDVADSSGNGYNLTNTNSVTFVSGKFSNASNYVRSSSQVLSTTNSLGISGGSITIMGRVKVNTAPASGDSYYLMYQAEGSTSKINYFVYYQNNGGTKRLAFERLRGGVSDDVFYYNVDLGTTDFYFIVLTYDGSTVRGYVNGNNIGNVASSGNGSADRGTGFWIGASRIPDNYSEVKIDEVVVLNTALSGSTITAIYNANSEICVSVGCAGNPVPILTSITPTSTWQNSGNTNVKVLGSSMVSSTIVLFNSTSTGVTTTYASSTEINALLSSSLLATPSTSTISLFTPTPGGGTSSSTNFYVLASSTATSTATSTAVDFLEVYTGYILDLVFIAFVSSMVFIFVFK